MVSSIGHENSMAPRRQLVNNAQIVMYLVIVASRGTIRILSLKILYSSSL